MDEAKEGQVAHKISGRLTTDGAAIQRHPLLSVVMFCASFSAMTPVAVFYAS
jgi:hypothetical protein